MYPYSYPYSDGGFQWTAWHPRGVTVRRFLLTPDGDQSNFGLRGTVRDTNCKDSLSARTRPSTSTQVQGRPRKYLFFIVKTPEELDLSKGVWTIPAGRMKSGGEHRVPLSPRAIEIAKAQPAGAYLFAGGKENAPLSNMAMLELLKRMGREDLTVHGFRSTFRDWAAECTTYPREVCEMALAHAISNKVEAAYRRGDLFEKRRRLMLDWAKYCDALKRSGDVVSISRRKA